MSDLVERLRDDPGVAECYEAADEIAGLRAQLASARKALEAVDSEIVLTGQVKDLVDAALTDEKGNPK